MNIVVVFNLSHDEEHSYSQVYDILEKEFGLKKFEIQENRKVLTPTTTVIGETNQFSSAKQAAENIIDRLAEDEIVLDRIVVSHSNDYVLIG